jgi:predicted GNAT family acetyltransferase
VANLDISTFVVSSEHQSKGFGSQLSYHCFAFADRDSLPIWLVSFSASYGLVSGTCAISTKI